MAGGRNSVAGGEDEYDTDSFLSGEESGEEIEDEADAMYNGRPVKIKHMSPTFEENQELESGDEDAATFDPVEGSYTRPIDMERDDASMVESDDEDDNDTLIEHVIQMKRTVKVTRGGKNIRYKSLVVVGDGQGRGGFSYASGVDGAAATEKAHIQARRVLMRVPLWRGRSLYHDVEAKYNATKVMIRRAPFGSGVKAGMVMDLICEVMGIKDARCKIFGSTNASNVVRATFMALAKARSLEVDCLNRGIDVRRYVQPEDDVVYDRKLYEGGEFTYAECVGRGSQLDYVRRVLVPEDADRLVTEHGAFNDRRYQGIGGTGEEGFFPNQPLEQRLDPSKAPDDILRYPYKEPKFVLWDAIANENAYDTYEQNKWFFDELNQLDDRQGNAYIRSIIRDAKKEERELLRQQYIAAGQEIPEELAAEVSEEENAIDDDESSQDEDESDDDADDDLDVIFSDGSDGDAKP